jgi:hypothetical protein
MTILEILSDFRFRASSTYWEGKIAVFLYIPHTTIDDDPEGA